MATTTDLQTLKINYLTQDQYDTALANGQINNNEFYITPYSSTLSASFFISLIEGDEYLMEINPTMQESETKVLVNQINEVIG